MLADLFNRYEWLLWVVLVGLLLAAAHGGDYVARVAERRGRTHDAHTLTVEGALLGLLSLLLGFTFSMANDHFVTRQHDLDSEVTAIAAVWRHAALLPPAEAAAARGLVRRDVDAQLALYAASDDESDIDTVVAAATSAPMALWQFARDYLAGHPADPEARALLVAVDTMIDAHRLRVASIRKVIAPSVLVLLTGVAMAGLCVMGYASRASGKMHSLLPPLMAIVVASVITLIVDLHSPSRGMIRLSTDGLTQLQAEVHAVP
ncbi:MAG: hypothetical protein JSR18_09810 [Proteobacteria bacterium]|nr:hypothetical protein [Pseudomonadota bacterium]